MQQNWHVSLLQSPAGCREQVGNQPGHLSQGAFCFHWHRRAGLPHHRRGQYSQRRCTNSSWCESVYLYQCLYFKVIYTKPCTQLLLPVSYLSPTPIKFHIALIHSVHKDLNLSFLFPVYFLRTSICLLSLFLPLTFYLSSLCKCTNLSYVLINSFLSAL